MKKLAMFAVSLTLLSACRDKSSRMIPEKCVVKHMPFDYERKSNALIPVNTRNFWTYTDSVYDPQTGVLATVSSEQINIKDVYQIDDLVYFDFTQILSQMTLRNDTLFSVTEKYGDKNSCYTLTPKLFSVTDTVDIGTTYRQLLYMDTAVVHTQAGNFAPNTVYDDGGHNRMYFHKGVGLVKMEFRPNRAMLRRSLTLKDHKVN